MTDCLHKPIHTNRFCQLLMLWLTVLLFNQMAVGQSKLPDGRPKAEKTSTIGVSSFTSLPSDPVLSDAFSAFWRGQITRPSRFFQQAADHADRLLANPSIESSTRWVRLAQRAVFRQYGYLLADLYESSSTLSSVESRRVWRERLLELNQALAAPSLPDSIRASLLLAKGITYMRLSKDTDGRQAFTTALSLCPNWPYLNTLLGDAYIEQENYAGAEQLLTRSYQRDSSLLLTQYMLGWVYLKTARLNEAEHMARQGLDLDSTFYPLYNLLSGVHEEYKQAGYATNLENIYKAMLRLNPRWTVGYTNLSFFYKEKGDYAAALNIVNKADSIHPETASVYNRKATIYESWTAKLTRDNESVKAKECQEKWLSSLKKCVELDSAYSAQLGNYYFNQFSTEGFREAERWYRIALQLDSNNVEANYQLGQIRRLTDKYQQAVPYYRRAIANKPRYASAYAMLAECYGRLDQRSQSIENYEKVLVLSPNDTDDLYRLGYQYANMADSLLTVKADSAQKANLVCEAQGLLERGARLGHPQCADLAYALQAEYGPTPDPAMAKHWYRRAALRIPFYKIAHAGLIRLYEEKKIALDTADYNFWKKVSQRSLEKLTVTCVTKYGRRSVNLYFFDDYLAGVHPLAYEKERVNLEEYGAKISDQVEQAVAKIYRLSKKGNVSFIELLTYALDANSEEKIKKISADIKLIAQQTDVPPNNSTTGDYVVLLDSLTQLQEKRLALKQDSREYRKQTAASYLKLGREQWRLNQNKQVLLQSAKRAVRLDSTNGEAVRLLALAWVLAPAGNDSLALHYNRFNKQHYNDHSYQDYFFDDLDSLKRSNPSLPLVDQYYGDIDTPYQQARRGHLGVEAARKERDPSRLRQIAEGFEAADTQEGLIKARQVYRQLTTQFPTDTSLAELEWQALLRINGESPPSKADSSRLNDLYTLLIRNQNVKILRQTIDDFITYTDQFNFNQLDILLACQVKLVALHQRWLDLSPDDESARDGLSTELFRQGYFQFRNGQFEQAMTNADDGLSFSIPSKAERCRSVIAMAQVYLGQLTGVAPELKRLGSMKWYGKAYPTYSDWMLSMYQLLKRKNIAPPEESEFRRLLVEIVHDDESLYIAGLLTDTDLLNGDGSQKKLWLDKHLKANNLQVYKAKEDDRERVQKALYESGQTSVLLKAAQTFRYRIANQGITNDEALYYARQSRNLYDLMGSKPGKIAGLKDSLAIGCGSLSFSFLRLGAYKEGLEVVEKAYEYNPNEDYTLTNLPLAYLLNNQFDKARKLYTDIAQRPWKADDRYKTYREVFLSDFNDLEKVNIRHPDFNRIRALLQPVKTLN